MVWQTTAPDGTKSVKDNRSILQDNTTYTKTTMNVDHFWGSDPASAAKDGHHQFVQMPKSDVGGTPTDPSLASLMDGLIYAKELTATESPANQDVQPFYINETAAGGVNPQIMRLLGIRSMALVETTGAGTNTIHYSHNVFSITGGTAGIFVATFGPSGGASPLPTDKYLFFGNAQFASTVGSVALASDALSTSKTVNEVTFSTINSAGTVTGAKYVWFVIFGG